MAHVRCIRPGRILLAVALGAVPGCTHWREYRVVPADDPCLVVDVARFELAPDSVLVYAKKPWGLRDGKGSSVDSLRLRTGESCRVEGFNTTERWTLVALENDHAIFRLHGHGTSDVGVYPFLPSGTYDGYLVVCACGGCRPDVSRAGE